ncbi:hypothetical protein FRC08_013159 [Ceratobasidium sp. 394]|nr:hypothetical protein FRC08_013159 [Ceratobasidium sp. 394]
MVLYSIIELFLEVYLLGIIRGEYSRMKLVTGWVCTTLSRAAAADLAIMSTIPLLRLRQRLVARRGEILVRAEGSIQFTTIWIIRSMPAELGSLMGRFTVL